MSVVGVQQKISKVCVLLQLVVVVLWPVLPLIPKAEATHAGTHMLLFWDGVSAPTGWTILTTYDGRFPRGESVANFGQTGGNATHTPTTSSVDLGAVSGQNSAGGILTSARSAVGHTHGTLAATIGSANNLPAFRSLKLIRYDAGIPNSVPSGAIALFDDNPGMPGSGWTRQTTQDGNFIRVNNTVATGGSDTHTHSITWPALGAASGTTDIGTLTNNRAASATHTHAAPAVSSTASMAALPPYIQVVVAKANADTAVPAGMVAMFDGAPGDGWDLRSEPGGPFYQHFMEGAVSYSGSSQGFATHDHASVTSGTSGNSGQTSGNGNGTGVAGANHNHSLTANFNTGSDSLPQYVNVVVAEKTNFDLSNYRWYVDTDTQDVTDPVGAPDIAQNTAITPIPVANGAPIATGELRLRINLTVSGGNLAASGVRFKLQYKAATDASCTAGSWTDVGAGGGAVEWRFASSSVTDGITLTASRLSPLSNVLQKYVKSNPSATNVNAATPGQTIEYDFHLEHNGAADASQYSFRLVKSNDVTLDTYGVCPTLTTAPGTDNLTRGGQYWGDQTRSEGYYWVD